MNLKSQNSGNEVYDAGYDAYINIVMRNVKEGIGAVAHNFNDLAESSFVEGLADAARGLMAHIV